MNNLNRAPKEEAKTWYDVIGPVYPLAVLPLNVQQDEGLISLTAADGVVLCPVRQFNPQLITERGTIAAVVDERVARLWVIAKELEIRQLGFSEWSTAASVLSPLRGREKSFVEELFACVDDASRDKILEAYVQRSAYGALVNGENLTIPARRPMFSE